MQFLVNRGIVVEAESIEEAMEKTKPAEGITTSLSVNARGATAPVRPLPAGMSAARPNE